jgi:hypothetical protein
MLTVMCATFKFKARAWNFFVEKGHTSYCGLVRGPHVDKQQAVVHLTAKIIV